MGYIYNFIFTINNQDYIKCIFGMVFVEELSSLQSIKILFHRDTEEYLLYEGRLYNGLEPFAARLQKVLNNKLLLALPINKGIGYVFNQYLSGNMRGFSMGEIYLLWSPPDKIQPNVQTWLYNGQHGDIVLYITENYFWTYCDKSQGENYITYSEFMKNYKPTFSCIIPHQTARQWLAQCEYLLATVKENEARNT